MLRAKIRSTETRTVTVHGEGVEGIQELLEQNRPDGFELVAAPVTMEKGSTTISAAGIFKRRDELQEIEGKSLEELRELLPVGWQLLHVTRA